MWFDVRYQRVALPTSGDRKKDKTSRNWSRQLGQRQDWREWILNDIEWLAEKRWMARLSYGVNMFFVWSWFPLRVRQFAERTVNSRLATLGLREKRKNHATSSGASVYNSEPLKAPWLCILYHWAKRLKCSCSGARDLPRWKFGMAIPILAPWRSAETKLVSNYRERER